MKKIQMVDLKTQYHRIKPEIDAAIQEVLESTAFINGPSVKSFQNNLETYLNVKHVIPVANGTDALQIAMMALGLKPGDEVITASFTYVATAEVIALLGLTPILVDVLPDTFNIDPAAVEKAVTPKTKAIVPVHLFGQCADMEAIMSIAQKYGIYVIEDTAQAIGAEFEFSNGEKKMAGTIGQIGCTSFFPSKNLGCFGDGGAIFTSDDLLAQKLRMIANHGQSVRYYHDEVGVNSRLDSIQASILDIKLKSLNSYTASRQSLACRYNSLFSNIKGVETPVESGFSSHVYHQYTLKLTQHDRNQLKEHLEANEVPAMIYYPVPLHMQKAYKSERYKQGDFPVTELLCKQVISLPMHTEMDDEQFAWIEKHVLNFFNK